jgi:hypothetical protein
VHIDVLVERIGSSLPEEWGNADDEGVGWEGGYVGETYDTYDLITEAGDPPLNHSELIEDVVRALPQHTWAQRDFYRLRTDLRLRYGWKEFASTIGATSSPITAATPTTRITSRPGRCWRRSGRPCAPAGSFAR